MEETIRELKVSWSSEAEIQYYMIYYYFVVIVLFHFSVFYIILEEENEIEIVAFWDNRNDPKKLNL